MSRIRNGTLCVVTNFSLHGVTVKRSTSSVPHNMCKATTHPRRPRPRMMVRLMDRISVGVHVNRAVGNHPLESLHMKSLVPK